MNRLFLKYYFDTTKFNIIFSIVFGLQEIAICFGTFGTLFSFLIYRYYQNDQYFFYLNHGFTKKELMVKVFMINFTISFILYLVFY